MVINNESIMCWYPTFRDNAKAFSGVPDNPPAAPAAVKPETLSWSGIIKKDSAQFTNWEVFAKEINSNLTSEELLL